MKRTLLLSAAATFALAGVVTEIAARPASTDEVARSVAKSSVADEQQATGAMSKTQVAAKKKAPKKKAKK